MGELPLVFSHSFTTISTFHLSAPITPLIPSLRLQSLKPWLYTREEQADLEMWLQTDAILISSLWTLAR